MKVSEIYSGSYLKAADLKGRAVEAQIETVSLEEFDDGAKKLVVQFAGRDKSLVVNKTNASVIADKYGDDTDNWIGKPLELHPERVPFQGKMVDALRVRIPAPAVSTDGLEEDLGW